MHMADALLSPAVGGGFYAIAGGLLAYSSMKVSKDPGYERKIPLMGVMGAFVFAAQMINFSIPGTGSSGHIGGGLMLAVLLGPYASFVVMASILTVQCLLFADGGLFALGCNIFNLAFWPAFLGFPLYRLLAGNSSARNRILLASIIAVVFSLEIGALGVAVETVLSGRSELPFAKFAGIMLLIHLPIAAAEGVLTALVILFVRRLISNRATTSSSGIGFSESYSTANAVILTVALLTGGLLAWFASADPDGLEWSIAKVHGQAELPASENATASELQKVQAKTALLADYSLPGKPGEAEESDETKWPAPNAGTSISGIVGGILTALIVLIIGLLLKRTSASSAREAGVHT